MQCKNGTAIYTHTHIHTHTRNELPYQTFGIQYIHLYISAAYLNQKTVGRSIRQKMLVKLREEIPTSFLACQLC